MVLPSMPQFQSHSMKTSRKAVASRANAGQMLDAHGLNHLIKAADKQHSSSGHGGNGAGSAGSTAGAHSETKGSGAGSGSDSSSSSASSESKGSDSNGARAATVKAAMVHAWRG